jgi:hypothetical protein
MHRDPGGIWFVALRLASVFCLLIPRTCHVPWDFIQVGGPIYLAGSIGDKCIFEIADAESAYRGGYWTDLGQLW